MTKLSIILVSYNSWIDLQRCLPTVIANSPEDAELIVVDNASDDGSAEKLIAVYPQVKLIRSGQNIGFGGANNLGAQAAKGEYLIFLNPDTTVTSGWIDPLLRPMIEDSQIGMTTPKILQMVIPQKINTCGNDVHLSGTAMCRGMNRDAESYSQKEKVNAISGAAFAVSREYFFFLGGFDPLFFLYVEDTELSMRCLLNGKSILCIPESIVYHDYALSFGPRKVYYQERNRLYMLRKILKPETLKNLSLILFISQIMTWGYCLMHGPREIRNKLDAATWMRKNQELIQSANARIELLRKVSDFELLRQFGWKVDFEQTTSPLIAFLAHCFFDPLYYLSSKAALRRISKEK